MVSSASLQGGSSTESFLPAEVTLPAFPIPRSGLPHPASREITQVKKFLGIVHSRLLGKGPCRHGIQKQQLGPPETWTMGLALIFWEAEPTGSVVCGGG